MSSFDAEGLEQEARSALLEYYSSECRAHGTYILSLALAVLAFIEIILPLKFTVILWDTCISGKIVVSFIGASFGVLGLRLLTRTTFWGTLASLALEAAPINDQEFSKRYCRALAERTASSTLLAKLHHGCIRAFERNHKALNCFVNLSQKGIFILIEYLLFWFLGCIILRMTSI